LRFLLFDIYYDEPKYSDQNRLPTPNTSKENWKKSPVSSGFEKSHKIALVKQGTELATEHFNSDALGL
jgi:hypothetical protein